MRFLKLLWTAFFGVFIFSIVVAQVGVTSISDMENQAVKYEKEGNNLELARCQIHLATLYKEKNNIPKSIEYSLKAIKTNETLGNQNAVKVISVNVGMMYEEIDNHEQALVYFRKSLKINQKLDKKTDIISDLINISQTLQNQKNFSESNQNLEKAVAMAQELTDMVSLKNCYATLSENYDKLGNSAKAREYFDLAASIKTHLQKEELKKFESRTKEAETESSAKDVVIKTKDGKIQQITREQQLTLELLEQQKAYSELKEQEFLAKERLQEAHQRNTYLIIASLAAILLLVTVSLLLIFKQLYAKKKANRKLKESNQQILEQKNEIEQQRDVVTLQKKKITDSIHYAQRIQSAVLPPLSIIEKVAKDYFILYRPRDIVSGDFFWMSEKDGIFIIAAVDCTGHGVPGAFMSMLGVAFLNDIVNKISLNRQLRSLQANEILNQLKEHVINSLHQSGKPTENNDGMDIALCIVDFDRKQMQYAGAHNPVYLIRQGALSILEADKMPIGVYKSSEESFTNHVMELEKDDLIYLFSDGFYDQLGGSGPVPMKLFSSNFRKHLLEIHQKPMSEQKLLLEGLYNRWKGNREQIDDVLVIGFKFEPGVTSQA
jgi:serine phosphatase RsbU (regulator of sigma subunit)